MDKDIRERLGWKFTREDVSRLVYSESLLPDRRVANALRFFTGGRFGESAVLRWSDWHRDARPLTKLELARALKSVSKVEGPTKTTAHKGVPVHPDLEAILLEWWTHGWKAMMGRAPTEQDLLLPAVRGRHDRRGGIRTQTSSNRGFRSDCEKVGLRPRRQHAARHTFISLAQDDGAEGAVLRWVTHPPPSTAFDSYTRLDWLKLCAEVAKLRIPKAPAITRGESRGSGPDPSEAAEKAGYLGESTQESKRTTRPRGARTSEDSWVRPRSMAPRWRVWLPIRLPGVAAARSTPTPSRCASPSPGTRSRKGGGRRECEVVLEENGRLARRRSPWRSMSR